MASRLQGRIQGTLKVDTAQMTSMAQALADQGKDMRNRFNEIANVINHTKNYWTGDAAEKHRKLYNDQKGDVDKMLARLLEHPVDLGFISNEYIMAEKANIAEANALKPIL